ncbi:MAG: fuconate dehydratase, partial [Acidobacteriota bacterium]|nr:fuconate dehydratase [Acidobacteriota bacterium]
MAPSSTSTAAGPPLSWCVQPRKEIIVSEIRITGARVIDLRFPTSREQIGSDAVNKDPDYSAAYCILQTSTGLEGHGLTFTLGRGTDLVASALEYLTRYVVGRSLESITSNLCAFGRELTDDTQFRWLGPEKGVIHLATGALINAIWDLYAKAEGKPLWQLLMDLEPQQILSAVDFRYIDDAITRDEALEILQRARSNGQAERLARLRQTGYPAYTTSVGWFGYSEEKIRRLSKEALASGWTHFKLKVGGDAADDLRRGQIVREE